MAEARKFKLWRCLAIRKLRKYKDGFRVTHDRVDNVHRPLVLLHTQEALDYRWILRRRKNRKYNPAFNWSSIR